MAIELTGVVIRNERRLRLVFSNTLAAAAFTSTSFYTVANQDGLGPDCGVSAAIIVVGAATNVELALDSDLVDGALYQVSAIGVPATDATTSTAASTTLLRKGTSPAIQNAEPKASDAEVLLYGRDIVWTGGDYLETADGDLATVEGAPNACGALRRRLLGAPLPWAPGYSPRARSFVDLPLPAINALKGRLEQQVLADDRFEAVTVTLQINDDTPEESVFVVTPTLRGGKRAEPIYVQVQLP